MIKSNNILVQNWRSYKIPEVLWYQEGPGVRNTQFRDKGIKLLNVGNINDNLLDLSATRMYISEEEAYGKYKHFLVDEGDLIIASSGVVVNNFFNKITFVHQNNLPLCMNTSTIRFKEIDKNIISIKFFYYFLQTRIFTDQLRKLITGSAQLNFGPSHLKQISLPLPPFQQQQRIVKILDHADSIRRKNKQILEKYKELAQSVFNQFFQDSIKNKDQYEPIKELAIFIDYRGKTPNRISEGIPLISAKCVRPGYFDDSRLDFISEEEYKKIMVRGFPRPGDVLFTTEGATMGYTCRIPDGFKKFAVGQRLITLRPKLGYNSVFLDFVLNQPDIQHEISKLSTGSAAKGIRSATFAKIKLPIPPTELQNKFSEIIIKIESQKSLTQNSLKKSENLFQSLLQKAFKGEL